MAASEFTAVVKYEPTTAQNPDPEQSAASGSTLKGAAAFGGIASLGVAATFERSGGRHTPSRSFDGAATVSMSPVRTS
jgi:hypothetical protein